MIELNQVIKELITARELNVYTCVPAKVLSVDVKKAMCTVQIVIKKEYADGEVVEIPPITNVPIANYRAGKAFISLPVKPGHYVQLQFSQRSLDKWLAQGGVVDPADPRRFSLNDAIAYPGIYPFNEPPEGADADDIIIQNEKAVIRLTPAGKFKITNGQNELVDLVKQLSEQLSAALDALNVATTNTMLGPMKLINSATYGTLKGQVETITGKVETLKG